MRHHPRNDLITYGLAILSITFAIGGRLLLDPWVGSKFPFATVFLGVLVTAWYGGLRPALLAVVLGALGSDYFLMEPRGSFALRGFDQQVGLVLYVVTGLGISVLAGSMHAARQRAETSAEMVARQAALIDQSYDAVLVWDWDGPITYWNRGAELLYGFSREQAVGRVSYELLATTTTAGVPVFREPLEREGRWEGELRHATREGRAITVDARMVLIREGSRTFVVEANRDITWRKESEAALSEANRLLETRVGDRTAELEKANQKLQASEERFRMIVEGVRSHAIFMLDAKGFVFSWNPGAERFKGYKPEEIIGRHFSCFYTPEDIASGKPDRELQFAVKAGCFEEEGVRVRKDGSQFWAIVTITPVYDHAPDPIGFVKVTRDISDRKRIQEALREERDRFANIVATVPVVICTFRQRPDGSACFPFANPRIEQIYGIQAEDLQQNADLIFDRIHPEDLPTIRATIAESARSLTTWKCEYRVRHPVKGEIWVEGHAAVSAEPDGGILWQGYIADITPRKAAEKSLLESQERMHAVVENIFEGVVVSDLDGQFLHFNRAAVEMLGFASFEDCYRRLPDYYGVFELSTLEGRVISVEEWPMARLLAGERFRNLELRIRQLEQGWTRVVSYGGDIILDAFGRQIAFLTMFDITERKRAEEAMKVSEARFRLQIEGVKDHAIFMLDPLGKILTWNKAAERVDGYTAEEIIGQHYSCLFTPESIANGIPEHELQQAAREGKASVEGWRTRKDGTRFWANGSLSALYDDLGQVQGFAKVTRDITESRRAEEALRDRERMLRIVTSSARVGLVVVGAGYRYLFANEAYAEIFGLDAEEIIGRSVPEILPGGWPQIQPRLDQCLAGERVEYELTLPPSKPHKERSFTVVYEPRLTEDGPTVVVVVVDITQRKHAQESSRQQQVRLEGIVNSAMDGIITIDEDQRVVLANQSAERMFGWRAEELLGERIDCLIPERFRAAHTRHVHHFGESGVAARGIGLFGPISGLRADGTEFPLEASISQVVVEGRRLFTITARDMTERSRAAETQKKLEAQLHQSQKMEAFGQLAGGVAHDFNNLLTIILGYSDFLSTMLKDDAEKHGIVSEIQNAGKRAAALTRQLLAFTRQQVLAPSVLDLNIAIRDIEKMLRRLIGEDVQIATVLHAGISSVKVDPGQIEQVIMNLAVNARDAMPQGGKITMETSEVVLGESYSTSHAESRAGRYVVLAVSDTGSGMPPEVKARIFEPFFTTKGVGKGTGLGLAVVHGILKQSGGMIDVESEPGAGTTFKIYLPAVIRSPERAIPLAEAAPKRGVETILLVEDDDGVREYAACILQAFGYQVLKASGGKEALERMAKLDKQADMLLTDVVMPEMSGSTLAEKMLALYPGLKVLYQSGYTDDAIVRHGIQQAEVAFLQKPYTPNALAKKVREVLDRE